MRPLEANEERIVNIQTNPTILELSERTGYRHRPARRRSTLTRPAETVVQELGSDASRGLSRAEAKRRLEQYGPNELKAAPETPWWRRLLEQFENVLVIILLVAIVISVIEWLLQDPRETRSAL